jgi:hypothetical protein
MKKIHLYLKENFSGVDFVKVKILACVHNIM